MVYRTENIEIRCVRKDHFEMVLYHTVRYGTVPVLYSTVSFYSRDVRITFYILDVFTYVTVPYGTKIPR